MGPVATTEFTPWLSLFGGALIGLSAVMVMGLFGKMTGITNGLTTAIPGTRGPNYRGWRLSFLIGLVAALLVALLTTGAFPQQSVPTNVWGMALVGFGTSLGAGCTSGHGVCGLARLSPRSAVAVGVFLVAAVLATTLVRHVI